MPPIQHSILPAVMEYLTAKRKGKDALAEVAITAGEEGFDFACRRPMDLVLAETYAREMQIEAAKVKVRGTPENRAPGCHHGQGRGAPLWLRGKIPRYCRRLGQRFVLAGLRFNGALLHEARQQGVENGDQHERQEGGEQQPARNRKT